MILSFCGCKKMNANESNFSSGYITTSDFVSTDNDETQYYTLTQSDGTKVVVNENGEVIENTTINEDGSIVVIDKDTGATITIGSEKIKEFNNETGENTENVTSTVSKNENSTTSTNNKKPVASNKDNNENNTLVTTPTVPDNPQDTPTNNPTENTPSNNPPVEENPAELTPLTAAEIKQVEDYFFQLVNEERVRVGVQPLTRNSTLDKAANIRVNETLTNFSHTRPDGKSSNSVLTDVQYGIKGENIWSDDGVHWNTEVQYSAGTMGEILTNAGLIYSQQQKEDLSNIAREMFNSYKNSPGHYSHMIYNSYTNVGVSIISYRNENIITQHNLTIFTEQ